MRKARDHRQFVLGIVVGVPMMLAAALIVSLFFLDTSVPKETVANSGAVAPLTAEVRERGASSITVEMEKPSSQRVTLTPYDDAIEASSLRHRVPMSLIQAVIHSESGFDSNAVSPVGAQGLMQLMPGTAKEMRVINAFDARQNIEGGTRYLRWLANQFAGDWVTVVAAYNAGPETVRRYGGKVPPFAETQVYVQRVMKMVRQYRARASVDDTATALTWPADSQLVVPIKNTAKVEALDIRIQGSSAIRAASEGKVIQVAGNSTEGWSVRISHDARYQTTYSPLSRLNVIEGQNVTAGQRLGQIDATEMEGRLRFEVLESNQPRDPLDYRWKHHVTRNVARPE